MSSTYEAVQQSKSPQEAMLHIAQALDLILDNQSVAEQTDGWGPWIEGTNVTVPTVQGGNVVTFKKPEKTADEQRQDWLDGINGGNEQVSIPVVSGEQQLIRQAFIEPFVANPPEGLFKDSEAFESAYINGGGMWLYTYDREYVMQMSPANKRGILEDINVTHPDQTKEVMADILKESVQSSYAFEASTGGVQSVD